MNKINSIYTTISNGQVHIAADTKYVGSVESYNNCFTQLFAWIFGKSVSVNFDGKVHSLDKKGYAALIQSLDASKQNAKIEDLCRITLFRPSLEAGKLPNSKLKMRDVITAEDRHVLFQKLATAISTGNTTRALLMIGKGAELDASYYDRDLSPPAAFAKDTDNLQKHSAYKFTVFKAAPILQAARKANKTVLDFLKAAGANLSTTGQEYTFERKILDVKIKQTIGLDVAHHHHWHSPHHTTAIRPYLRQHPVVTTQDSRTSEKLYQLGASDSLVVAKKN